MTKLPWYFADADFPPYANKALIGRVAETPSGGIWFQTWDREAQKWKPGAPWYSLKGVRAVTPLELRRAGILK